MDERDCSRNRVGAITMKTRATAVAVVAMLVSLPALGVSKDVDLDRVNTAAESTVSLSVVTTSPVKIQNKITNRDVGQAFRFSWPSAGPGGFASSLGAGTTNGVGTIWTWQTTRQIYSFTGNQCTNDICLTRTTPADNASRGPFSVPGRSLTTSNVTVTADSLSSSLITFFSPPQELFLYTSSVEQLAPGVFRYKTMLQNLTGQPITVDQSAGPLGCETECGNSIREGSEVCDGSALNGATCETFNSTGTLGCAQDCRSYDLSGCTPAMCGNHDREANEQCDGTDLGDHNCGDFGDSESFGGGSLSCNEDCTYDLSGCSNVCGNGVSDGKELCDGTDLNGATCGSVSEGSTGTLACASNCQDYDLSQCSNICGNGVVEGGESCDGSNLGSASCADVEQGGSVDCNFDCTVDYSNCYDNYCGNGTVDNEGEECDGTDLNEHTCAGSGAGGGELGCTSSCSFDYSGCTDYCGNGVREGEESCDGSALNGRTCEDFGGDGMLACDDDCNFDTSKCFPSGTIDCDRPSTTTPVPANDTVETCEISAHPAKEISTKISVCGTLIPDGPDTCGTDQATSGTANVLVPDLDTTIGPVYFSSKSIQVVDADDDHVPQPTETVQLFIPLINSGTSPVTNVRGVLSSPAYDIDGNGTQDPVVINVSNAPYPNGACFAGFPSGPANCNSPAIPADPCNNLTPYIVTFPADHPQDVGRKFILTVFYDEVTTLGVGTGSQLSVPIVLGVGGAICGNGIVESDEACDDGNRLDGDCCSSSCQFEEAGSSCPDDGNVCTTDTCNATGACVRTFNTNPCDDENACTTFDQCDQGSCVGGPPPNCDDRNPCTDDSCDPSLGCTHMNNSEPCDDGSICTTNDSCSGGTCQGGSSRDCSDGNVCTNDTCDALQGCIHACNNNCNAKGEGYWKHLCQERQDDHGDDHGNAEFYTDRDVDCVNNSCTFAAVQTIDMLCSELDDHGGDKCQKAEKKFMALLLNLCRCRLQPNQTIDAHCEPHHQTVAQIVAHEDATLCNPNRTQEQCKHPDCAADDVINGQALWQNTLRITKQRTGLLISWQSVYGDPTMEATRKYRIWRRPYGSSAPYSMIGEVNDHTFTFLDTAAGAGSFVYEVTATY